MFYESLSNSRLKLSFSILHYKASDSKVFTAYIFDSFNYEVMEEEFNSFKEVKVAMIHSNNTPLHCN